MLWAAACVGYFGFLRAGEFTVPPSETYDSEVHLNLSDLAVDSHNEPTVVRIRIKQSKTDPFRQGVDIYLGRTDSAICPVKALVHYIAIRKPGPGPLFILSMGAPLTRTYLVANFQAALRQAGLEDSKYDRQNFWIGAATTAAQNGLEDTWQVAQ